MTVKHQKELKVGKLYRIDMSTVMYVGQYHDPWYADISYISNDEIILLLKKETVNVSPGICLTFLLKDQIFHNFCNPGGPISWLTDM